MKSCKLCEVCSDGQFITETTTSPDHDHEIMRKKKKHKERYTYTWVSSPRRGRLTAALKCSPLDSDNQMYYLGSRAKNCPQTLDVLSSHCKIYLRGRRTPRDSDAHHVTPTHTAYSTPLPIMHHCQQVLT